MSDEELIFVQINTKINFQISWPIEWLSTQWWVKMLYSKYYLVYKTNQPSLVREYFSYLANNNCHLTLLLDKVNVRTLTLAFEVETPNQIQYCIQSFHLPVKKTNWKVKSNFIL